MDASIGINVLALSDDHVRSGFHVTYGRSEWEGVQQPQLNGEVVGATFGQRHQKSVQNYDLVLKLVMLLNYTTLSVKIGRQVRRVWVNHTFILDREGAS